MRPDGRAYTVEEKRQEHPSAYRAWTADEEQELVRLHSEGAPVEELAHPLGRNPGGIRSRMIRLGLAGRTAVAAEPAAPVEPAQ